MVAERAAGALARALARLLLPAYPQAGTLAALVPDRILRLQVYGAPSAREAGPASAAEPDQGEDPEAAPVSATGDPGADLAPAERQARWEAWAVHPDAHGRTRLDTLLHQLGQTLGAALAIPASGESVVPALLRATWLLHLALPAALQPPRLRRTALALARAGAALPPGDPRRKELLDTLGRLLLALLPADPARYARVTRAVRTLLTAGGVPPADPCWATLERTRARLLAEQADAARYAADPAARPALVAAARRRQTGGGDWADLQIRLDDGQLVWAASYGSAFAPGAAGAAALAFERLLPLGGFHRGPVCGEPLHQVTPHPRRWPLASYIYHHAPARFDAFVFDELHELSAQDSAQAAAMFLLSRLPRPALGLTGSLFNGYADSVFLILLAFCRPIWDEFGFHDRGRFALRYGLFKLLKDLTNQDGGPRLRERGKASLRTEYSADPILRTLGPAPGFLPALVADYMLGVSAILTQEDSQHRPAPAGRAPDRPDRRPRGRARPGAAARLSPAGRRAAPTDRHGPLGPRAARQAAGRPGRAAQLSRARHGRRRQRRGPGRPAALPRPLSGGRPPGRGRRPAAGGRAAAQRALAARATRRRSWSVAVTCSSICAIPATRPSSPGCAA